MAIAFYVPPEYGPQAQQQQQQQNAGQPAIIDLHQQHYQQDANNNVIGGGDQLVNNQVGGGDNLPAVIDLVASIASSRFFQEVSSVFRMRSNQSGSAGAQSGTSGDSPAGDNQQRQPHHRAQSTRRRHPAARQYHHQRDNQVAPEDDSVPAPLPLLDLIPQPFRALPDIVTCHAGFSLRYGSTHPNQDDLSGTSDELPTMGYSSPLLERGTGPVPLSPGSSSQSPATMDFEASFKFEMSMTHAEETSNQQEDQVPETLSPEEGFRLAGAQLRQIADHFQRTRQSTRGRQSTFELNIVISVALPAAVLIGLGFAYFRQAS